MGSQIALLPALLLQVFYTIRSARLLMEQLESDLTVAFFGRIKEQAATAGLLSDVYFTVDGTRIEVWASLKSFRPKDTPPALG
jgi:transposase